VYAQLVAESLWPGTQLRLIEKSPQRVRFWANGDEHVLAPIVADNISVAPVSAPVELFESAPDARLADLEPGQAAHVVSISPGSRGIERRRLLDLGILPGTRVQVEMTSPSGDPTAYRIRGALIALRREQASHIHITPQEEKAQ
jgi:DtxR family Mn-dependent transcriptional regulator